ncbi:unnamed protein product [Sphagnum balticum]
MCCGPAGSLVLYVTHILTHLLTPESSLLPGARAISVRNVLCEMTKEPIEKVLLRASRDSGSPESIDGIQVDPDGF